MNSEKRPLNDFEIILESFRGLETIRLNLKNKSYKIGPMTDTDSKNLKNYKKRDKQVEENMLDRHKRSASALRENLLKRKQQIRMLKEQENLKSKEIS